MYSRKQKHVLLFRKSTLRGCYKLRQVTKHDTLVFEYFNFEIVILDLLLDPLLHPILDPISEPLLDSHIIQFLSLFGAGFRK